ncbi:butyrophilin-like protein 1 [Sardina pilchardus]|uniref:butyrophilin-like protein 1 n=1 Tax=Sardina pilchardus TaxID=27697 RepID=UPI002E141BD3
MLVILMGMMLSLGNTAAVTNFSLSVPDGPIPVQLGSSATLPCQINPPLNALPFKVHWYRTDEAKTPVLLYENQQIKETSADPQYRGRGSLVGDLEKGDVSLKLENLMQADRGAYECFVKSDLWYEKASVYLNMKVVGSVPLLSYTVVDKDQLNVTCVSDGWSPQPTLTWRNRKGREYNDNNPVCEYTTDADGLVRVSSWLLVSPSKSEWISCFVYLSDQEMKQGRVLPQIARTQAETIPLANTTSFRYTKIIKSDETGMVRPVGVD